MLKMEKVKKDYGEFHLDCSLEVQSGRVVGLIGQNGAGKTTVFKAALGLIRPKSGTGRVFGKDAWKLAGQDRQRMGVVLSDSGFSGYFGIRDVAAVVEKMYGKFDREYFLDMCRRYHLPEDKKIREFSTGMRAKLKLLAAVSHEAQLLILDEPTAGLDVVAREELIDILRAFMERDEKHSILISSHISSDLEGLCDELYMIHEGRIILHEETDVLLDDYAVFKLSREQFEKADRSYFLRVKKELWGWSCLTNRRNYYTENDPSLVFERGTIDELMTMMVKGESL